MSRLTRFALVLFLLCCMSSMAMAQHVVTLTWQWTQGTGQAATQFNVMRSTTSNGCVQTSPGVFPTGCSQVGNVPVTSAFQFLDTASAGNILLEGVTYFYVVVAQGSGVFSADSNQASATIPFTLAAPTGAAAVAK